MVKFIKPILLLATIILFFPHPVHAGNREDLKTADKLRCQGRHQEAIELCTRIIESEKEDPALLRKAYMQRAFNHGRLERYDKALADMDQVVALRPDQWSSYTARARTYRASGDLEKAIADFSRALEMKPGSAGVLEDRGDCYAEKGDRPKALADYREALANSRNKASIQAKIDALK